MESTRGYSIESYSIPSNPELTSIKRFSHSNFYSSLAAILLESISKLSILAKLKSHTAFNKAIPELYFYQYAGKADIGKLSKSHPEKSELVSSFFELLQYLSQNPEQSLNYWEFYTEDLGHMQSFNIAIRIILLSLINPDKKALKNIISNDSDPCEDLVNLLTCISNEFKLFIHLFDRLKDNVHNIKPDKQGIFPKIYIVRDNGYHLGLTQESLKVIQFEETKQDVEKLFCNQLSKTRMVKLDHNKSLSESQNTSINDSAPKDLEPKNDPALNALESLAENLMNSNIFLPNNTKIFEDISKRFEEKLPKVKKYLESSNHSKFILCDSCKENSPFVHKNCECLICLTCIGTKNFCPKCKKNFTASFVQSLLNPK